MENRIHPADISSFAKFTSRMPTGARLVPSALAPQEMHGSAMTVPTTPDGRYIVVRGRLWRAANPAWNDADRARLTADLMKARRRVASALHAGDAMALAEARRAVNASKIALGERGPVWWTDGAPDLNRRMIRNTPYAAWFEALPASPDATVGPGAKA